MKLSARSASTVVLALVACAGLVAPAHCQTTVTLHDNGPFVTGIAPGRDPVSEAVVGGAYGFPHSASLSYRAADDFVVPAGEVWHLDELVWFSYQIGSTTASTVTSVNLRLWSGASGPMGGALLVAGDTTTNRLRSTHWSNSYRCGNGLTSDTQRPIMETRCDLSWVPALGPGHYWIDVQSTGTLASGPWANTREPRAASDNAQQFNASSWVPAVDGGSGLARDFPFRVVGAKKRELYANPESITGSFFVTGTSPAGAPISETPDSSPYGFACATATGTRVSDEFVVPAGERWRLSELVCYAYQPGSSTSSTITAVNVRLWKGNNGPKSAQSVVIAGDTTTNRLLSSTWSGAYRVPFGDLANTTRPIMENHCDMKWTPELDEGFYWIDVQFAGSLASGPFVNPAEPSYTVFDAQQLGAGTWTTILASGPGVSTRDLPFRLFGASFRQSLDNGEFVTGVYGNSQISEDYHHGNYGFDVTSNWGSRIADDFVVAPGEELRLTDLHWYAFQPGMTSTQSTITAANVRIWKGQGGPAAGATIVAGDTATNRLLDSQWSGVYRVHLGVPWETERPIMRNRLDVSWVPPLGAGHYWIDVQFTGSLPWGVWANPVQPFSPNANAQQTSNGWQTTFDPYDAAVEFPFELGFQSSDAHASSYCTGKTNSLGCVPAMSFAGGPSATASTGFVIQVRNLRNNVLGHCFYGLVPSAAPFQGGTKCVAPPTRRMANQLSGGTAGPALDCTGAFTYDFNAFAANSADPALVAGRTVFVQTWSRDSASIGTSSLSDALAFTLAP